MAGNPPLWVPVLFAAGLVSLAVSVLYAVRSFLQPKVVAGIDTTGFEAVMDSDRGDRDEGGEPTMDARETRRELVRAYHAAIDDNTLVLDRVSSRFQRALWLLSASILLLTGGALGLLFHGG